MRRLLPAPVLSLMLFAIWLLLTQSVSPGQMLLGAILALLGPVFTASLRPGQVRVRHPWRVLVLTAIVLRDVVASAWVVARYQFSRDPQRDAGFVRVPIEMHSTAGLAVLAVIITATPDTIWVELSDDHRWLLLHSIDARDPDALIELIRGRYERPLMEIFE